MLVAFKVVIGILLIFLALGLACAIWLASRREPGIDRRRMGQPAPVDPYFFPIGDAPGFTREQLEQLALASHARITADPLHRSLDVLPSAGALRRISGSGRSEIPSGTSTARNPLVLWGRR